VAMDRFVRALIQWQAGSRPEPARNLPVAQLRERYSAQATQLSAGVRDAGIETKDQLIDGGDGEFGVRTYLPPTDRGRLDGR